ncbi:MAG: lysylphosphatidylglycerol synthase transmembrane domain-containing protein [Chloroflexota bacterium]|jgi:hypothetical protein
MAGKLSSNRQRLWIGIAVSVACLAAVLVFVDPSEIVATMTETRYELWLLTAASLLIFMILRATRWRFMLNSGLDRPQRLPYGTVFHIQNIGYFLNNLLPFRLGDVARAVLIGNVPPLSISRGLSTMVAERVFDLAFIVLLFPFTLGGIASLPPAVGSAVRLAGLAAFLGVVVLILAANRPQLALRTAEALLNRIPKLNPKSWIRRLEDLLSGLDSLTRFKDGIALLLLSVIVWLPIIAGYYVGLRAVNLDVTWQQAAFVVCIAAFGVTAPSSPGQVGVFEASVTLAVAGVLGFPEAEAAAFAVLYHVINYAVMGVLGAIGISRTGKTFSHVIASARSMVRSRT